MGYIWNLWLLQACGDSLGEGSGLAGGGFRTCFVKSCGVFYLFFAVTPTLATVLQKSGLGFIGHKIYLKKADCFK